MFHRAPGEASVASADTVRSGLVAESDKVSKYNRNQIAMMDVPPEPAPPR